MVLPLGDLQKTRIVPVITYVLIALNVVVYVAQWDQGGDGRIEFAYSVIPYEITHGVDLIGPVPVVIPGDVRPLGDDLPELARSGDPGGTERLTPQAPGPYPIWLTLFTAMFLHGSPLHLAGNMLSLWIYGDNVEEVLGGFRYVVVYLACGVAGSLLQIAASPNSTIPTLGASGAIAGVMGAYLIWFPHNRIRVLVFRFITEMPAGLVIGLWIAMQIWEGFGSFGRMGDSGGVAYLAHVGGAGAGIVVALVYQDRARQVIAQNDPAQGWFYGPDEGDEPAELAGSPRAR